MSSGDDVVIIGQVINHQRTNADADDIGIINGQQRNDAAEKKKTEKNLNELTGREKQLLEEFARVNTRSEDRVKFLISAMGLTEDNFNRLFIEIVKEYDHHQDAE